jgi:chromosome segregation ATPase
MNEIKKLVIVFIIGAILGAGICGGLVYRSGARRIGQLGGELDEITRINSELARRLAEREAMVDQLTEDSRKLRESIERRQEIIDAAKRELESSRSSVAKIRALLILIRDAKQNIDRDYSAVYDIDRSTDIPAN